MAVSAMDAPQAAASRKQATREDRSSAPREHLDLSYSHLLVVPIADIVRFRRLRTLRLDNNALDNVPWTELMTLPTLTDVNLSHNRITELPPEIGAWHTVQRLDVSHNRIEIVPPQLWTFFTEPVYARTITRSGSGRFVEHSVAATAKLEQQHNGVAPREFLWRVLCDDDPDDTYYVNVRCKASEPHWEFDALGSGRPRIWLEGNERLRPLSAPHSDETVLEWPGDWLALAKAWRVECGGGNGAQDDASDTEESKSHGAVQEEEWRQQSATGATARTRRREQRSRAIREGHARQAKQSEM